MEEKNLNEPQKEEKVPQKAIHRETPLSILLTNYSGRLGRILSNISVLGFVLICVSVLSFLIVPFYYMLLILLPIFTLGIIMLDEVSRNWYLGLWEGAGKVTDFAEFVMNASGIVGIISLATAVLSLVFLLLDKGNVSKGRVAYSIIVLILIIAFMILKLLGGIA